MKDFLDVLWEQMEKPRSAQDEAAYLLRLKSLATTAPPVRKIPSHSPGQALRAATLTTAPDSRFFAMRPDVELFFYELTVDRYVEREGTSVHAESSGLHRGTSGDAEPLVPSSRTAASSPEPRWFRLAKEKDAQRAFGRWDPLPGEAQVLETIAMGADLYTLRVRDHDEATLQYLAEVGADYDVPVLLRCAEEEELARALFVQADTWIALEGAVAVPELLELPPFKGRKVLLPYGNADLEIPHQLDQLILHFEMIEEPRI